MADTAQPSDDADASQAGELVFCGSTSWETIGRKQADDGSTSLPAPQRLRALLGVPIGFIAGGSAACHCVALDAEGRTYTWGRNERGQLGHGDLYTRNSPTIVASLARHKVVKASLGRQHTIVITSEGLSLGFGSNQHGQLGSGSWKEDVEKSPVKSLVTDATYVCCGAEFTVWLTSATGSSIVSAGLPQYGQLGHGTDNEYNAKEGSVKLVHEPQPRPRAIAAIASKNITRVACGNNHCVAADSEGFVYTWGFGGHGRLGHKVQKDEWLPRVVETFQRGNILPATAVIAAGSAYSAASAAGGQLFMWGRVKTTGENWMYPKPVLDLSGWSIRSLDCGNTSSFAAAEDSCISWGTAVYGELGYGSTGPKSSASPKKIDTLEGFHTISVAAGMGHSMFIVSREKNTDKLEQIDVFEGIDSMQVSASKDSDDAPSTDKKRKAPAKGKGKPAKKKALSDSDADDEDDEDEEEPSSPDHSDEPKAKAAIHEAEDVQDSETVKSSSLPTTLHVGSDINEAEDERGLEYSSPSSSSSEEVQVNTIIEELKLDYPDIGNGYFNLLGEDLQKESPRLQEDLKKGLKKTKRFLKGGDIQGAMQQVEEVLNQFHAIQYLRTELLPKHRSTNVMSNTKDMEPAANDTTKKSSGVEKHGGKEPILDITDPYDLYKRLFIYALNPNGKNSSVKRFASFEITPWEFYKGTDFMVFLIKKVRKEELIMGGSGKGTSHVVDECIRKYKEVSSAACISYVRLGMLNEATQMLKETIKSMKRDGALIVQRGRVYNMILQEAIHPKDLIDGDELQILPEDQEHKENWSKCCLQDLTKVQDYFVDLFLKDEEFLGEFTLDWMQKNKYVYLSLCMWECHEREKKKVQRGSKAGVDEVVIYAFHGAVLMNRLDILKNVFLQEWPDLDINAKSSKGETALHIAAKKGYDLMLKYLLMHEKLDINARAGTEEDKKARKYRDLRHSAVLHITKDSTALHVATEHGYANLVELLCRDEKNNPHIKSIRCHEEDADNITALDIVYENLRPEVRKKRCHRHKKNNCGKCHVSYEDIEKILLSMEAVQKGVDRLYRNRQVLVDAANTLLVGAALIASVTFAGWLQPPLGYAQYYDFPTPSPAPRGTYDSYIGVGGNVGIQTFALFNSLSFFFAIATVIVGADAAFPMHRYKYIGHVVKTMQLLLRRAIKFLMVSVVCVLGAFGSAAVVILPPHDYFRKHMVLTIFIGGGLCSVVLWQLLSRHSETVQRLNATINKVISERTNIF